MLENILLKATEKITAASDLRQLQELKVEFLGKSSLINQEMRKLGSLSPDERKTYGQKINSIKQKIQQIIDKKGDQLNLKQLEESFVKEALDLTIPARKKMQGSVHPITQCTEELIQIFAKYGFNIKDGPSIEDDWHNFTALNIPKNHPARQMQDTFYLKGDNDKLLRTHTSNVQIRTMMSGTPPFRFIAPGRTYRCDSDMTHTPMFHQIEGLSIDKDIHMGHLKYIIINFIKDFFEQPNIEIQFRPSFFPFTEPSVEVDIKMKNSTKWLEVLGCGMVHPNVLKNAGVNPEEYQGFAFGLGIERFAMLKYGIKDLRQFFEGDLRWLNHYNFAAFDIPTFAGGLTR